MAGAIYIADDESAEPTPSAEDLARAALTVARRCASGGAVWCVAPRWPGHARHVAVEFVHPVIVGKRALPAAAVEGPDLLGQLRLFCRSGDVLVALARADEPAVVSAMRRAGAWGIATVWIGLGPCPPAGAADHVLWCGDGEDDAVHGGRFVLLYHLLWELAHVCFEHPGLMKADDEGQAARQGPTCITCADEGRLAEVVELVDGSAARVRTPVGVEEVDITLVAGARAGDLVLVHAGAALSMVEAEGGAVP